MAAEASRSAASADSYIGSLISLTSKCEIRYEGVLCSINTEESSIGLRNVQSFGTEGRKKDGHIPPSEKMYEYILFRGSDIKDLQVKSAPPKPTPVHNDPAIIQSHYPGPTPASASMPSSGSGYISDLVPQNVQTGMPRATFQGGLPLYQPSGNLGSWGSTSAASPANVSGLGMPMYWPGFYPPAGPSHLPPPPLLHPPGLQMPPSIQQPMQYPGTSMSVPLPSSSFTGTDAPLPSGPLNLPGENSLKPTVVPQSSSSLFPPSSLSSTFLASVVASSQMTNPASEYPPAFLSAKDYSSVHPAVTVAPSMPFISKAEIDTVSIKPTAAPGPSVSWNTVLPSTTDSTRGSNIASAFPPTVIPSVSYASAHPDATFTTSLPFTSSISRPEIDPVSIKSAPVPGPSVSYPAMAHSLSSTSSGLLSSNQGNTFVASQVTQLSQSGAPSISSAPALETSSKGPEKNLKRLEASEEDLTESKTPVLEAKEPILPLPRNRKYNDVFSQTYNFHRNRGRGRGRGSELARSATKFEEDFDFNAMNEKFNKEEVWGHLGKSNVSARERDKEPLDYEYDTNFEEDSLEMSPEAKTKPVYVKDDFFDTLSCQSLEHSNRAARNKFSEQRRIDTETFGDFQRGQRGYGGRGYRGGWSRGPFHGRGYGYGGRGRGYGYG